MTLLCLFCHQCGRLTSADTAHVDTQRRAFCPDCAAARDILLAWAIARLDDGATAPQNDDDDDDDPIPF